MERGHTPKRNGVHFSNRYAFGVEECPRLDGGLKPDLPKQVISGYRGMSPSRCRECPHLNSRRRVSGMDA